MTPPLKDISEIRRLLAAFYDGTASPAQRQALADFFASVTDVSALPDDMKADMLMFRAVADSEPVASAPSDLEQRLESTIDRLAVADRARRRPLMWWGLSLAAAAVVALMLVSPLARYDSTSPLGQSSNISRIGVVADTVVPEPSGQLADTDDIIMADQDACKEHKQQVRHVMPAAARRRYRHPRHTSASLQARNDTEDKEMSSGRKKSNHVYVEDPKKAADIAKRAIRSFASATRIADAGIETMNTSYGDIENLLTKVQYESD